MCAQKKYDKFSSLGYLIKKIRKFASSSWKKQVFEQQIYENWPKIVGEKIAPYTAPYSLKKNTLFIKTINSVWATELSFLSESIMLKINEFLKQNLIKQIYFSIGDITKPSEKAFGPVDWENIPLSPEEHDTINKATEPLNGELKEILNRTMMKAIQRRKFHHELNNKK